MNRRPGLLSTSTNRPAPDRRQQVELARLVQLCSGDSDPADYGMILGRHRSGTGTATTRASAGRSPLQHIDNVCQPTDPFEIRRPPPCADSAALAEQHLPRLEQRGEGRAIGHVTPAPDAQVAGFDMLQPDDTFDPGRLRIGHARFDRRTTSPKATRVHPALEIGRSSIGILRRRQAIEHVHQRVHARPELAPFLVERRPGRRQRRAPAAAAALGRFT